MSLPSKAEGWSAPGVPFKGKSLKKKKKTEISNDNNNKNSTGAQEPPWGGWNSKGGITLSSCKERSALKIGSAEAWKGI